MMSGIKDCSFGGPASNWTIASIACYFLAGCMLCCIPQPDPLFKTKDDQNENKDGRKEQQQQQRDIEENTVNNNSNNYVIPEVAVTDTATVVSTDAPTPVMAVTGVVAMEPVPVAERAVETEA